MHAKLNIRPSSLLYREVTSSGVPLTWTQKSTISDLEQDDCFD